MVASCVRADSSVAIRIWNGSSCWLSEIFSTAGSSMPEMARPSVRMVRPTARRPDSERRRLQPLLHVLYPTGVSGGWPVTTATTF